MKKLANSPMFSPVQLGALSLRNRIVMSPMTRSRANQDGDVMPITVTYYQQRASAGLLISEATQPSDQGQGYCRTPGIHKPHHIDAWKHVTQAVHDAGSLIALQIMHVGRIGHTLNQVAPLGTVAPSALRPKGQMFTDQEGPVDFPVPKEMTLDDIRVAIHDFQRATTNAFDAGFDAVELHAANGYLPMQFLSSGTNQRTDGYGGDTTRRLRFTLEALEGMIHAAGSGRVGIRISPGGTYNDIHDDDPMETYTALIEEMSSMPLAWVHLQRVGWDGVEVLRQKLLDSPLPLIMAGEYTGESGAALLEQGGADAIGYGRAFIANPDLPERFAQGLPLNEPDKSTFFSPGEEGYIDYPFHDPS